MAVMGIDSGCFPRSSGYFYVYFMRKLTNKLPKKIEERIAPPPAY